MTPMENVEGIESINNIMVFYIIVEWRIQQTQDQL